MTGPDWITGRANRARALLAELRGGRTNTPLYTAEDLANLSDEDALLDADAFNLDLSGGHTSVHVDVVDTGRAVIVVPGPGGGQARVAREAPGRFLVEDTDTEQPVGYVRTYQAAGALFARHLGFDTHTVTVDYEKG